VSGRCSCGFRTALYFADVGITKFDRPATPRTKFSGCDNHEKTEDQHYVCYSLEYLTLRSNCTSMHDDERKMVARHDGTMVNTAGLHLAQLVSRETEWWQSSGHDSGPRYTRWVKQ
jgi:hypothetical protein